MTVVTLRPNSTTFADSSSTVSGAASRHAALSDDSDVSYVDAIATGPEQSAYFEVGFGDLTLPSDAVIKRASVQVRSQKVYNPLNATTELIPADGFGSHFVESAITWTSPTTVTAITSDLSYTDAAIDGVTLGLGMSSSLSATYRLFEASLDIIYVARPVVTVSAPAEAATIVDTNRPTVQWSQSIDTDGGSTHFEVKVFTAAQYGAGSFNPDSSSPFTASGDLFVGSSFRWTTIDTLPNGTYRAYVRIGQIINGVMFWSAWDNNTFTMDVDQPADPSVALTVQADDARITLDIGAPEEGRVNLVTNPRAGAARTTDWAPNGLPTFAATTLGFGGSPLPPSDMPPVQETGFHAVGDGTNDRFETSVALTSGRTYTASGWMRLRSLTATDVRMRMLKPDGRTIGVEAVLSTVGAWQRLSITFTADSTGNFLLQSRQNGAGAADWDATCFMVEEAASVGAYFDGYMKQYAWSGTANASTSYAISTDLFEVEYSYDDGETWAPLRTVEGDGIATPVAAAVTVWDFEAGNGIEATYRARALHNSSAPYAASAWIEASGTWSADGVWWLKHPLRPDLSMIVVPRSLPSIERAARQGVFQSLGASLPVVVTDTRTADAGTVVFRLDTDEERVLFDVLLDLRCTLLLQGPPDAHWTDRYLMLGDHSRARVIDKAWCAQTFDTFNWTRTRRPDGGLLSVPI